MAGLESRHSLAFLLLAGLVWPLALAAFGLEIASYALALFAASAFSARKKKQPYLIAGLPLAIATMHFCWGGGFWVSMVKSLLK